MVPWRGLLYPSRQLLEPNKHWFNKWIDGYLYQPWVLCFIPRSESLRNILHNASTKDHWNEEQSAPWTMNLRPDLSWCSSSPLAQSLHAVILFFFLVGFVKAPWFPNMPAACLFFICLWFIKPQMWVGGRNSALCFLSDKYHHQLHTYGSY